VWLSDAIPHLHEVADEMCVIRSMTTDQFNHAPAELLLLSGSPQAGRPSIGSWVTYGLGSESENLPGFVVLIVDLTENTLQAITLSGAAYVLEPKEWVSPLKMNLFYLAALIALVAAGIALYRGITKKKA
jgi:hypothetical protein